MDRKRWVRFLFSSLYSLLPQTDSKSKPKTPAFFLAMCTVYGQHGKTQELMEISIGTTCSLLHMLVFVQLRIYFFKHLGVAASSALQYCR